MDSELGQIQPFIQAYVNAIGAILHANVTVVDRDLVRIGGTPLFADRLGETLSATCFYRTVVDSGAGGLVKNEKGSDCEACERNRECEELADLAYPILYDGAVAGVIGIIAVSEEERDRLLETRSHLEEFLKYMSMLIESRIATLRDKRRLEQKLSNVISLSRNEVEFMGENRAVRELRDLARKIAPSSSTVLIAGESGTGKEVLANLIHSLGDRRDKLMVSINCAAIPEHLVESELFGYEGGAFTGADRGGRVGKFELAHESTLFLDEIGEMPPPVQSKLLRVLQERTVQRVGGTKNIPIDVRILCATNRNLTELIDSGRFRRDLFYRLNVIPMVIPPLRERRDDIPLFTEAFISAYNKRLRKAITGIAPEAMEAFMGYDWPGNVRELKNVIEYLANIVDRDAIQLSDLPNHLLLRAEGRSGRGTLKALLRSHEKHILESAAVRAAGAEAKKQVARRLGVSLATLYRKLAEHGLPLE